MANKLDFNLIPAYESTSPFMMLPRGIESAIKRFPETEERIDGALMFCAHIMNCEPESTPNAARRAGAYFRAALGEYASIEEAFNRERPRSTPKFRLRGTENPVPHILKQLRNVQVHLAASKMSERVIALIMKNYPDAEPVNVTIWTMNDLTDAHLKRLRAFKEGHYNRAQGTQMVNWINTRQTQFGIHDIVHRGLLEAAERIVKTYLPKAQAAGSPS